MRQINGVRLGLECGALLLASVGIVFASGASEPVGTVASRDSLGALRGGQSPVCYTNVNKTCSATFPPSPCEYTACLLSFPFWNCPRMTGRDGVHENGYTTCSTNVYGFQGTTTGTKLCGYSTTCVGCVHLVLFGGYVCATDTNQSVPYTVATCSVIFTSPGCD